VTGGLEGIAREAERPDEVAPGARRDHPEHGVGRDRLAVVEHSVDDLVDGPVASGRDQVTLTAGQGVPGDLGGVAGMGRPHDPVVEPRIGQDALDLREVRAGLPAARTRVGDDDQRAEGAGHGGSMVMAAAPLGS
jgi:hypothetical protein